MWSAIQSDLLEFVSTVQNDAKKTMDTVLGTTAELDEDAEHEKRQLQDLRRSYNTFKDSVDECDRREYEKFLRQFSLSSQAVEIGTILDEEPDVPRYYAELVPAVMIPEEFWSRYFFKLKLLLRGAANPLDVLDDDENLDWETNDPVSECAAFVTDADSVPPPRAVGSEASLSSLTPDPEKDLMRKQIRVLVARVSELEKALTEAKNELKLYDSKDRVDAAGASGAVCAPPAPPSLPSPEIPPSEPSPTSDVPDGSVIERGSSAMSRFENETSTDNSNHGVSPKASQKSKSEVSLANLDDEWDEENSWS